MGCHNESESLAKVSLMDKQLLTHKQKVTGPACVTFREPSQTPPTSNSCERFTFTKVPGFQQCILARDSHIPQSVCIGSKPKTESKYKHRGPLGRILSPELFSQASQVPRQRYSIAHHISLCFCYTLFFPSDLTHILK